MYVTFNGYKWFWPPLGKEIVGNEETVGGGGEGEGKVSRELDEEYR